MIRASKKSQAHEFVSKLPDGYNTFVGDSSGGGSWGGASTGNTGIGFLSMDAALNGATDNTAVVAFVIDLI